MSAPHSSRAHAVFGPSSSKRWHNCRASMALSATLPPAAGSIFADEGTAAHELANVCLGWKLDAITYQGCFVWLDAPDGNVMRQEMPEEAEPARVFEVTEEMVAAVQLYLDECRKYMTPEWEVIIEERVYISDLINGTCDFAAYNPTTKVLVVIDFKYGRHISVDPTENTQAILYALGVLKRFSNRGVSSVTILIVQPRDGGPPLKAWFPEVTDLFDWEFDLTTSAEIGQHLIDHPNEILDSDYAVGDWCKFCPALGACPVKAKSMFDLAQAQFDVVIDDVGDPVEMVKFPKPAELDGFALRDMLSHLESFEAWKKAVIAFAHAECEQGREIPGWKLVQKRAYRKWKDEEALIKAANDFGIPYYQEPKLKSPAQLEKLVPGKNPAERKKWLEPFVEAKSSGTVLAPIDDPRPAVARSAGDQFEEVSDG